MKGFKTAAAAVSAAAVLITAAVFLIAAYFDSSVQNKYNSVTGTYIIENLPDKIDNNERQYLYIKYSAGSKKILFGIYDSSGETIVTGVAEKENGVPENGFKLYSGHREKNCKQSGYEYIGSISFSDNKYCYNAKGQDSRELRKISDVPILP